MPSGQLSVGLEDVGEVTHIRLGGVIDEDNHLLTLSDQIGKSTVVLNTADVERINSCGVRDWATWLSELERRNVAVYMTECSTAIMTQVNLVNNFVGHARVLSFFAPYFCPPPCESDSILLVQTESLERSQPRAPQCRCEKCDSQMEFDEIESAYFRFLAHVPTPDVPNELRDLIGKMSNPDQPQLRERPAPVASGMVQSVAPPAQLGRASNAHPQVVPSSAPPARQPSPIGTNPARSVAPGATTGASSKKMLFAVVGMLGMAIALLLYAVLRR